MKNINKLYADYKKKRSKIKFNEFEKTKGVKTKRKIAVIVPYRDNALKERSKQLAEFVKYMPKFLKGYDYKIFVIEQDEGRKFNRGALLNIGLKMAIEEGYTILVTHDVDLLPCDDMLGYYTTYSKYPIHQGWRWKDKYTFDDFLGGILTLTPKQVRMTNGYPNNFWGWGGEDDALYNRIVLSGLDEVCRPSTGCIKEMKHQNISSNKNKVNLMKKKNILNDLKHWKNHGVSNVKYKILDETKMKPHITKYTVEI